MNKLWLTLLAAGIAGVGCDRAIPSEGSASQDAGLHRFNGFDVSNASIPTSEIFRGGPPRDGIPSIDNPVFIAPDEADFLIPDDIVISLQRGNDIRAYPFRILVWHEVVNDTIDDQAVAVTYCPLCGTAMVFSREFDDQVLTFGVSGLLYHSDVLLYDREGESLWTQIGLEALSGPMKGNALEWLPSRQMTWKSWKETYPQGKVLSTNTGHSRNYHDGTVYALYEESPGTMFPVPTHREDLKQKDWVVGVLVEGAAVAFPVERLPSDKWVSHRVGEREIRLRYDETSQSTEVEMLPEEVEWPHVFSYWFAWQAFYSETAVWEP